jgi:hypothetical protein
VHSRSCAGSDNFGAVDSEPVFGTSHSEGYEEDNRIRQCSSLCSCFEWLSDVAGLFMTTTVDVYDVDFYTFGNVGSTENVCVAVRAGSTFFCSSYSFDGVLHFSTLHRFTVSRFSVGRY